jgi:hypothetical protein
MRNRKLHQKLEGLIPDQNIDPAIDCQLPRTFYQRISNFENSEKRAFRILSREYPNSTGYLISFSFNCGFYS